MNIVKFPSKAVKADTKEMPAKGWVYRGLFLDEDHPVGDKAFTAGIEMVRGFDFRGAFSNYPENPVPPFYAKQELLSSIVRLDDIAKASVVAMDLVRDLEASKELETLYRTLLHNKLTAVSLKYIPEHLIGFIYWLGEDLGTTRLLGQHPLSPLFSRYGWHKTAVNQRAKLKPKK